ncbi:hypothetical protein IE81DRAFT_342707 [Ceraceosorus guamensis]|uniref:Uncharacterized protein n=1 Tax=Ceraceosorus guamensis TaxID=1522189 RepID=A0A316VS72_9BASI|nr:hypothetical protein IE81DRAFT_342707 [Ceraceosorus guamensis]PWN40489.1 hypothetical protein IE81DRAFT_342707 [Ceraceosorus guamensis]
MDVRLKEDLAHVTLHQRHQVLVRYTKNLNNISGHSPLLFDDLLLRISSASGVAFCLRAFKQVDWCLDALLVYRKRALDSRVDEAAVKTFVDIWKKRDQAEDLMRGIAARLALDPHESLLFALYRGLSARSASLLVKGLSKIKYAVHRAEDSRVPAIELLVVRLAQDVLQVDALRKLLPVCTASSIENLLWTLDDEILLRLDQNCLDLLVEAQPHALTRWIESTDSRRTPERASLRQKLIARACVAPSSFGSENASIGLAFTMRLIKGQVPEAKVDQLSVDTILKAVGSQRQGTTKHQLDLCNAYFASSLSRDTAVSQTKGSLSNTLLKRAVRVIKLLFARDEAGDASAASRLLECLPSTPSSPYLKNLTEDRLLRFPRPLRPRLIAILNRGPEATWQDLLKSVDEETMVRLGLLSMLDTAHALELVEALQSKGDTWPVRCAGSWAPKRITPGRTRVTRLDQLSLRAKRLFVLSCARLVITAAWSASDEPWSEVAKREGTYAEKDPALRAGKAIVESFLRGAKHHAYIEELLVKRAKSGERRGHYCVVALCLALVSGDAEMVPKTFGALLDRCRRDADARVALNSVIHVPGGLSEGLAIIFPVIGDACLDKIVAYAASRQKEPDFNEQETMVWAHFLSEVLKRRIEAVLEGDDAMILDGLLAPLQNVDKSMRHCRGVTVTPHDAARLPLIGNWLDRLTKKEWNMCSSNRMAFIRSQKNPSVFRTLVTRIVEPRENFMSLHTFARQYANASAALENADGGDTEVVDEQAEVRLWKWGLSEETNAQEIRWRWEHGTSGQKGRLISLLALQSGLLRTALHPILGRYSARQLYVDELEIDPQVFTTLRVRARDLWLDARRPRYRTSAQSLSRLTDLIRFHVHASDDPEVRQQWQDATRLGSELFVAASETEDDMDVKQGGNWQEDLEEMLALGHIEVEQVLFAASKFTNSYETLVPILKLKMLAILARASNPALLLPESKAILLDTDLSAWHRSLCLNLSILKKLRRQVARGWMLTLYKACQHAMQPHRLSEKDKSAPPPVKVSTAKALVERARDSGIFDPDDTIDFALLVLEMMPHIDVYLLVANLFVQLSLKGIALERSSVLVALLIRRQPMEHRSGLFDKTFNVQPCPPDQQKEITSLFCNATRSQLDLSDRAIVHYNSTMYLPSLEAISEAHQAELVPLIHRDSSSELQHILRVYKTPIEALNQGASPHLIAAIARAGGDGAEAFLGLLCQASRCIRTMQRQVDRIKDEDLSAEEKHGLERLRGVNSRRWMRAAMVQTICRALRSTLEDETLRGASSSASDRLIHLLVQTAGSYIEQSERDTLITIVRELVHLHLARPAERAEVLIAARCILSQTQEAARNSTSTKLDLELHAAIYAMEWSLLGCVSISEQAATTIDLFERFVKVARGYAGAAAFRRAFKLFEFQTGHAGHLFDHGTDKNGWNARLSLMQHLTAHARRCPDEAARQFIMDRLIDWSEIFVKAGLGLEKDAQVKSFVQKMQDGWSELDLQVELMIRSANLLQKEEWSHTVA